MSRYEAQRDAFIADGTWTCLGAFSCGLHAVTHGKKVNYIRTFLYVIGGRGNALIVIVDAFLPSVDYFKLLRPWPEESLGLFCRAETHKKEGIVQLDDARVLRDLITRMAGQLMSSGRWIANR